MKITSNSWLSQSAHSTYVWDPSSPTGQTPVTRVDDNTDIKHSNEGIATKFDLESGNEDEYGYISCEVQFSQNGSSLGHQSSNVFCKLHSYTSRICWWAKYRACWKTISRSRPYF